MEQRLKGKHIAFVAGHGVEHAQLAKPIQQLQLLGAKISVISAEVEPHLKAKDTQDTYPVDQPLKSADHNQYHAVVVSGGNNNQVDEHVVVAFLRNIARAGKPVAATSHGAPLLIAADLVKNRKVTADPQLKQKMIDAGGTWSENEVVVDGQIITSRHSKDLPAFSVAVADALTA